MGKAYFTAIRSTSAGKKSQLIQVPCKPSASPVLVSLAVRNMVKEREIHFVKTDSRETRRMWTVKSRP